MSDQAEGGTPERGLPARMWGAAILRAEVYEEVGRDRGANVQAGFVVLLASLVAAVPDYGLGWDAMAWAAAASLAQWLLWTGITYLIGDKLMGGDAAWGALLRTLGFARTPGLLLGLDPVVGGIGFAVQIWTLAAGVVAIRRALGFGTVRALVTALLGIVPYWVILALVLH